MKDIAILGCGPAGLLAAHAAEQAGYEPRIYSIKQKSNIPGSVYLHERIPGLTGVYPDNNVQYIRLGTSQGYAEKVYGDADRNTGWDNYFAVYPSWDCMRAYELLWKHWENRIIDTPVHFEKMREIILGHDLTITTLPANTACFMTREHKFHGSRYWIKTIPTPPADRDRHVTVYNGLPGDLWYRWSISAGLCTIESTHELWPGDPDVIEGFKCTTTNCDCWEFAGVVKAGRWAQWHHGVLLNHAYDTAVKALAG